MTVSIVAKILFTQLLLRLHAFKNKFEIVPLVMHIKTEYIFLQIERIFFIPLQIFFQYQKKNNRTCRKEQ
jgi:hypothetical protein